LTEQRVRPPLHLAKAYHENDWAISLLTSPTAGLLEGDRLEVSAELEAGAQAALISPAACRVHTMPQGSAQIVQAFKLEGNAVLDVWPAPLVLQTVAALEQETEIDCAAGATLLYTEIVAPGRAAYGESFQFREWRSRLRLRRGGELIAFENFNCRPAVGQPADWREHYPEGLYASLYCLSPAPLEGLAESLHALECEGATLGASPLRGGGLAVKILATNGVELRRAILAVREILIPATGAVFPPALKRAQTFFY
jgi:urease accessory protein